MYHSDSVQLKLFELARLFEIQHAHATFTQQHALPLVGEVSNVFEVLNMSAYIVKNVVTFVKQIAAFRSLPQDDQLILLKSFYPEKHCVRVAYHYNQEKDGLPMLAVSGQQFPSIKNTLRKITCNMTAFRKAFLSIFG